MCVEAGFCPMDDQQAVHSNLVLLTGNQSKLHSPDTANATKLSVNHSQLQYLPS
jgi:hypothetical protein